MIENSSTKLVATVLSRLLVIHSNNNNDNDDNDNNEGGERLWDWKEVVLSVRIVTGALEKGSKRFSSVVKEAGLDGTNAAISESLLNPKWST